MKQKVQEAYRLLHPRPVVLICAGEKPNVMACSWITPVSDEPFMVAVAIWKENYTFELIEEKKEFTVNVPQPELLDAVWIAGTKSGRKVDKIRTCNLRVRKANKVDAYVIENCIANLECVVREKVFAGEHTVYIAEVVDAYAEGFEKTWKTKILLHLGGKDFVTFGESFRPKTD
ncbi:MAG: flavin reductase family protein [Archaeoglobaceae archaeon]